MNFEHNPDNKEQSRSKLSPIYELLGAHTALEMSNLYSEEDQKLFKSGKWDYDNPELITNQVKSMLEQIDPHELTEEEIDWRNEILWFWYHHAISTAISKNDLTAARKYAEIALQIQPLDHPNKITKLLYYLVHDNLVEAEKWAATITEEPEKSTGRDLLKDWKNR